MKRLLFLPLLTLFALTALAQDKPAALPHPSAKWEKDIAKFEAADAKQMPAKGSTLFVGSSSIRMWDLEKFWPDTTTINRGFGGSTLADSIYYFDRIIKKYEPKTIVIYAGDNDVAKGLTSEETIEDFKTLKGMIDKSLPEARVIYIAIKPSIKRWEMWPTMKAANDGIAAICAADKNYSFADISKPMLANEQPPPADLFLKDGLHSSAKGYTSWKAVIDPLLNKK